MSGYILVLFWIGACALLAKHINVYRTETLNEIEVNKCVWLYAFITFFPVIVMAATRSLEIGDTYSYFSSFKSMPDSWEALPEYLSGQHSDTGFYFISSIIKIIVTKEPRVYFWILAIFQGLVIVYFYRHFSSSYFISVFLFVVSGDYVSWMYNGIRQFTAVTIILLATAFIIKKKYLPAIIIIILASTIHQSALLMIPIIFIVQGDVWNKKTVLFMVAVLLMITFVSQFTSWLDETLAETQYKNVINDINSFANTGTNFFRVLVYSIPAFLSFIFRKKINSSGDVIVKISSNMSIVSAGLYILSMFTSGIFFGRLPIYCSLFGYILLPWIAEKCFDNLLHKRVFLLVMVVLYLFFYYFQMHITWDLF